MPHVRPHLLPNVIAAQAPGVRLLRGPPLTVQDTYPWLPSAPVPAGKTPRAPFSRPWNSQQSCQLGLLWPHSSLKATFQVLPALGAQWSQHFHGHSAHRRAAYSGHPPAPGWPCLGLPRFVYPGSFGYSCSELQDKCRHSQSLIPSGEPLGLGCSSRRCD